jgi:putative flippase GtrA
VVADVVDAPNAGGTVGRFYDRHGEKLRYLVVGVYNTVVSFVVFWLAIHFLAPPLEAASGWTAEAVALVLQWVVWVIMVVHSTIMMKYVAFRSKGHLGRQIIRAYMVYLPAQGISSVILWAAMTVFGLSAVVGQAAAVAIATVFSYIGHKYFTFKTPLEVGEVPPRELIEGEDALI